MTHLDLVADPAMKVVCEVGRTTAMDHHLIAILGGGVVSDAAVASVMGHGSPKTPTGRRTQCTLGWIWRFSDRGIG